MKKWHSLTDLSRMIPITVPDGQKGDWEVTTFTVSKKESELDLIRSMVSDYGHGRYVEAGTYKALKYRVAGTSR